MAAVKSSTLLKGVSEFSICIFDIYFQISVKFSVTDVYILLLISCKFYENWHSKSPILLRGINELFSIFSAFIVQFQ
jgi:hypothetical protein